MGHGNLAERALAPCIPSMADFPYSIRAESLITESCGKMIDDINDDHDCDDHHHHDDDHDDDDDDDNNYC